jgi:hypothetical protein
VWRTRRASILLRHSPIAGTDMYQCGECEVAVAHDLR